MRNPALRLDSSLRLLALLGAIAAVLIAAPLLARAGSHTTSTRTTSIANGFSSDDGSDFSWAIYDPADGTSTVNTNGDDWQDIARLLRNEKSTVFWFALDGDGYIVRDPDVVARAREIAKPIQELGRKQGELGAKQGQLGARQAKLGAAQARIGARQAVLSQRLAVLAANEARDGYESRRSERRAIEAEMREVSEQQGELGARQGELGAQQGPLGAEQGELGRQQAEMSKAAGAELRKLAEDAIRDHKAEPVRGRRRGTI